MCGIRFIMLDNSRKQRLLHYFSSGLLTEQYVFDFRSNSFHAFLDCTLMKNQIQRPSTEQMLKHPFIKDLTNEKMFRNQLKDHIDHTKKKKAEKSKGEIKVLAFLEGNHISCCLSCPSFKLMINLC